LISSRTAVESKSNRSCNHRNITVKPAQQNAARFKYRRIKKEERRKTAKKTRTLSSTGDVHWYYTVNCEEDRKEHCQTAHITRCAPLSTANNVL